MPNGILLRRDIHSLFMPTHQSACTCAMQIRNATVPRRDPSRSATTYRRYGYWPRVIGTPLAYHPVARAELHEGA